VNRDPTRSRIIGCRSREPAVLSLRRKRHCRPQRRAEKPVFRRVQELYADRPVLREERTTGIDSVGKPVQPIMATKQGSRTSNPSRASTTSLRMATNIPASVGTRHTHWRKTR